MADLQIVPVYNKVEAQYVEMMVPLYSYGCEKKIKKALSHLKVYNKVEAQYVEMMVPLYSYGCEKKIKKALSHLKGIYSVKVDYYNQKVTVWGICNKVDVLAMVKKKRKDARFWNVDENDDNAEIVEDDVKEETTKPSSDSDKASSFYTYSSSSPRIKIRPHLALIRTSSFTWRAVKKVFNRSVSF